MQAASDFRKATEALERFGGMLKGIVSTLSEGLAESSRNHAVMSDSFDPFGFKTAFKIIREQGREPATPEEARAILGITR